MLYSLHYDEFIKVDRFFRKLCTIDIEMIPSRHILQISNMMRSFENGELYNCF